jgi:mitochondrial import receptor subunit TOM40
MRSPKLTTHTKFSSQVAQNMIQLEHDYQGQDYSLNAKAVNPWPTDLTGIFIGNYLQSFTKNLALGAEFLYQRPTPGMSEISASYLAKLTSTDKNWIATAQIQAMGIVQATYWQKLSEKVEVAADLQLIAVPARRDAVATLGAKYDLRMSTFRAQLDSTGKVSALLEQRFAPTFAFLVSGEIDHFKVCLLYACRADPKSKRACPEHGQGRCWRDDRELESDARRDGHASTTIVARINLRSWSGVV